jgi:hypothetical protein
MWYAVRTTIRTTAGTGIASKLVPAGRAELAGVKSDHPSPERSKNNPAEAGLFCRHVLF